MSDKKKTEKAAPTGQSSILIKAPNMQTVELYLAGNAPYVQNKFAQKSVEIIKATQEAGPTAGSRKKREPKDFAAACKNATYRSRQGWEGMPASAFRKAAISACRLVGFKMTLAKLAIFTEADGFDRDDGTPLVRIYGKNRMDIRPARNDNGSVDLRARPMWENWMACVRVRFDADIFTATDVTNLMMRIGMQVGIGEGRADSKDSAGIGWGSYDISSLEVFEKFKEDMA